MAGLAGVATAILVPQVGRLVTNGRMGAEVGLATLRVPPVFLDSPVGLPAPGVEGLVGRQVPLLAVAVVVPAGRTQVLHARTEQRLGGRVDDLSPFRDVARTKTRRPVKGVPSIPDMRPTVGRDTACRGKPLVRARPVVGVRRR